MRQTLVLSLALLASAQSPAVAQACMGLASYASAPVQVTATGVVRDLSSTLGASAGYGIPASVYGTVGIATTSYDGEDGSTRELAAQLGYQLELGTAGQIQICPTASFAIGMGPNDDIAGVQESSRVGAVGLNVGTVLGTNPRIRVVPSAGLSFASASHKAENRSGSSLFEISSSYGLARFGVGIILNQHISVRPGVEIPLGLEGSDPKFGLTLGYNFGVTR
jgi:hypothetical protein